MYIYIYVNIHIHIYIFIQHSSAESSASRNARATDATPTCEWTRIWMVVSPCRCGGVSVPV